MRGDHEWMTNTQTHPQASPSSPLVWCDRPEADVWWGQAGIDALLWADAEPYAYPPKERPTDGSRELTDGLA